jgi:phosphomannomutase/phosphoglucomutase
MSSLSTAAASTNTKNTKIPRHAFREYDIRGVADVDLSDDFARALGKTFALMLRRELGSGPAPRVAVGRDGRLSTGRLFAALTEGLIEGGADVEAIGVGPSPLLYFAAHHLGTDGSVMITASHNPAPDNGFKLMRGKTSLHGKDIQILGDLIEQGTLSSDGVPRGSIVEKDIQPAYIENVRRSSSFTRTDIRFVVDAGNGAAGPLGVATLRALGFDPDTLFCDLDGRFPNHHPDPTVPKNLEALKKRVLETGAQLGVAWDGDGDRIGCIDEKGDVIWGDKLLILFARAVLRDNPGAAILGEVKCSETLYSAIAAAGGRPIMSKTGHSLIKAKMKAEGALLAGEMSGHMFFADRYPGFDDAIYATARLLEIVGLEGKGLTELLADVPLTFATPEIRVDCPDAIKFDVVARVGNRYKATHRVIDIDGARVDFGDGAWGLCRASNTQPVLVLRFEAQTEARLEAVKAEVEEAVREAVEETLAARGMDASALGAPGTGSH